MSERPKDGADPDATVMMPAGGAARLPDAEPDSDATVMDPAREPDANATVMMPPRQPDADATVMVPTREPDANATVMMPPRQPDADATVMIPAREPDANATVMLPARQTDADATVMIPRAGIHPGQTGLDDADADATIAIPTPGRKRGAESPSLPSAPAAGANASGADIAALGGLNALVAAANPVLAVVAQIRHALRHPDPDGLRASLRASIDAFETAARAAGTNDDTVAAASLALCALVDESAASTPWGAGWATNGLLAERHGGSAGGDAFFERLEQCMAEPAARRDLLEFFVICLALGFEGRYRQVTDGRQALAELRGRLFELLRVQRPARDGELSGNWRGVAAPARRPAGALGLWAAGSVAGLLLAATYIGYSLSLGNLSDPLARELAQLKAAPEAERRRAATVASPRLAEQLKPEIERGEIAVVDAAGTSTIVIRSDRLFASGSARLEPAVEPVVLRLVEVLNGVTGTILVTGHSDDVPIRTARFPSNWELSTERAASVVKLMAGKISDTSRLRAEGLADSAPAVPNDTAANRARNRRVEIILRSPP